MQTVFPTLRILSYEQAVAFYVRGLGFTIDWEWRHEAGFPVFMQVSRDGLSFYLSEHSGDCEPGGCVHLYVSDVDAWHAVAVAGKVAVRTPPTDQAWGNRDMVLADPFGNRIVVAQRLQTPVRALPVLEAAPAPAPKPGKGFRAVTRHEGITLDPGHCWFLPLVGESDPRLFALKLAFPRFDPARRAAYEAAARLAIHEGLGEPEASRDVQHVDVCDLPADPEGEGFIELPDLPAYLRWRASRTDG